MRMAKIVLMPKFKENEIFKFNDTLYY